MMVHFDHDRSERKVSKTTFRDGFLCFFLYFVGLREGTWISRIEISNIRVKMCPFGVFAPPTQSSGSQAVLNGSKNEA